MCNTTKQRIAAALRQLMTERPFDKITVQNLMTATNMKRQSFYYHFQDTRDVLMWICRQEFIEPLAASDLEFVDWMIEAMTLLNRDRIFYRKLLDACYEHFAGEFDRKAMYPRVTELLYPGLEGQLNQNQKFVVSFCVQAGTNYLAGFVHSHKALNPDEIREKLGFLLEEFGIPLTDVGIIN